MKRLIVLLGGLGACARPLPPLALRAPLATDTDLASVSGPPANYESPFVWDEVDNLVFARLSRGFSVHLSGEAVNANSVDEVADSAWFTNRPRGSKLHGGCKPDDLLTDDVENGTWLIDHGKDNGSSHGFRVSIPGKGKYMLKTDDPDEKEIASAASAIGSALYAGVGFNTSCEQVVAIRREQLKLSPGLKITGNSGATRPFDDKELDTILKIAGQLPDGRVRMVASKWLPGEPLGPFTYDGVRADDPNDAIAHERRRELRGSRLLAAWIDHWDAREQNSMDVWMADEGTPRRGHVVHYFIDTSDALGGLNVPYEMAIRLGHAYVFDVAASLRSLFTFGIEERAWDVAARVPGREKFGYFHAAYDPSTWVGAYPNPAFLEMTERDGAWMARQIARFSEADLREIAGYGRFMDPADTKYLAAVLIARQHLLLARYLTRLSPLGELRTEGASICATDFARLRGLPTGRYTARANGRDLPVETGDDGRVCVAPPASGSSEIAITNGSAAGPLVITTYDGAHVAGARRPE